MAVKVCAMVVPESEEAPATLIAVTVQLKVVPATLEVREIAVVCPLQIVSEGGVAVATGIGLIVIVALIGVFCTTIGCRGNGIDCSAKGGRCGRECLSYSISRARESTKYQLAINPSKSSACDIRRREMPVVWPLQMVSEEGVAVATGIGLTVTVTLIGVPAQPFAVGVTVYTAVPGEVVVAVSVCAMEFPDPADAPLTFVCVTVQVKVVPATLEVREMPVV